MRSHADVSDKSTRGKELSGVLRERACRESGRVAVNDTGVPNYKITGLSADLVVRLGENRRGIDPRRGEDKAM